MGSDKRLWDVDHPYYCNEGNYYKTGLSQVFDSWKEFIESDGLCDFDMNLLFRWDWKSYDKGSDVLMLFWILQRKGIFMSDIINVLKSDEIEIIEWLKPRAKHLMKLWEPLV